MNNPYLPYPVRLADVRVETEDKSIRTFRLEFIDPDQARAFTYVPGQFAELSLAGLGESPIGIASSPSEGEHLLFSVFRTGKVTQALHALAPGDTMGVRGPLGNGFPLSELKGKNLVIVAGGFAVTTLRAAMVWLLDPGRRGDYGEITFIYGARTPGMLLYREELAAWAARADVSTHVTVDRQAAGWDGLVGFVPGVVEDAAPKPENAVALVCGPPVMIKFTQPVLEKLGWQAGQILLSLENRMKCGIGICGRCNVGPHYVCKDGPVFTKAELDRLPKEY
jgi:sulfhydrogenase subunit gamma (sulfur reductase)